MRSCLIELAFIDNIDDAKILAEKQDQLAKHIAKGICKYLGIEYKSDNEDKNTEIPKINNTDTFYRVVCGSFSNRVYAEEKIEELKKLGINDAFIAVYKKE